MAATAFTVNATNWQTASKLSELVRAISERNVAIGGTALAYDGDGTWSTTAYSAISAGDDISHYNFFNYIDNWISTNCGKFIDASAAFAGASDIELIANMDALAVLIGKADSFALTDFPLIAGDSISAAWFTERIDMLNQLRAIPMYKNSTGDAIDPATNGGNWYGGGDHVGGTHQVPHTATQLSNLEASLSGPTASSTAPFAHCMHSNSTEALYCKMQSCKLNYYIDSATPVHKAEIYMKAVAETDGWLVHSSGLTQNVYNNVFSATSPTKGSNQETPEILATTVSDFSSFPQTGGSVEDGAGWKAAATDPYLGVVKLDLTNGTAW